jgi:hypothetical protein
VFATLLGPLPRPPLPLAAPPSDVLQAIVRAQESAGLEPLIDGGFGIGESPAERWRVTVALTDRVVKAVLRGPFSAGRDTALEQGRGDDRAVWIDGTWAAVTSARSEVLQLLAAGCPIIEIHEPAAVAIGTDEARRRLFRDAHAALLDGIVGSHMSLAITDGSASPAGAETILAPPYSSLAVDLIAGPDNWRLVVAARGDRGVICGALSPSRDADDRPELLLWAAGYAASTGGRGPSRVGLASASSMAHLPWEVAARKLTILGEAARLADLPPDERRVRLDPRSVDIRSAALGLVAPRGKRTRGRHA